MWQQYCIVYLFPPYTVSSEIIFVSPNPELMLVYVKVITFPCIGSACIVFCCVTLVCIVLPCCVVSCCVGFLSLWHRLCWLPGLGFAEPQKPVSSSGARVKLLFIVHAHLYFIVYWFFLSVVHVKLLFLFIAKGRKEWVYFSILRNQRGKTLSFLSAGYWALTKVFFLRIEDSASQISLDWIASSPAGDAQWRCTIWSV